MKYILLFFTFFSFAQQTQFVDFKTVDARLTINSDQKMISGTVEYIFDVLKPVDTVKIDAQQMIFSQVKLNGNLIRFDVNEKQLLLIAPFQKGKNSIEFYYQAHPKKALYFVGSKAANNLQIWTQGQGKYTSNWFPSFDDVNEKLTFNLAISFDNKYDVISNGVLKSKRTSKDQIVWEYQMKEPMSSYLLMLAIGNFEKKQLVSKSKISLEYYIEPKDASKIEPTYRNSKLIFDFLEKEIGVKYPWEIYRQVPVREFLYAGMENTTATLFSTSYVVDSVGVVDRPYSNVNAHELAHQWFGNMITATESKQHWLQEGFATYFALLAEKEIYGADYFYFKLYETAQQLKFASRTDSIPVLNAKASSLTFYEKGAWALFVIHQELGDKKFKKVIKNYLKKHAFQSVTTTDFFNEIKKVSTFDTTKFSKVWLESVAFDTHKANELLLKNINIKKLLEVEKMKSKPLLEKEVLFSKLLQSDVFFKLKEYIVNQLKNEKYEAKKQLLKEALRTNNVYVRQVVAASLPIISEDFRLEYETLLNDKSYQTQEIALLYLWRNFPNERHRYLDQSKTWIGFNDFNLRTMWLSLALSTEDFSEDSSALITELIEYSSTNYEATTRQNALEKLIAFEIITDEVLINLVNATTHHMWQFSKFGRESIRKLLKNKDKRASFERILTNLNPEEQFQLERLLKE